MTILLIQKKLIIQYYWAEMGVWLIRLRFLNSETTQTSLRAYSVKAIHSFKISKSDRKHIRSDKEPLGE